MAKATAKSKSRKQAGKKGSTRSKKSSVEKAVTSEITELRQFAEESPLRAAAATVVAGLAVAGLVGTRTGRTLLKTSAGLAMPIITRWAGSKAVEQVTT